MGTASLFGHRDPLRERSPGPSLPFLGGGGGAEPRNVTAVGSAIGNVAPLWGPSSGMEPRHRRGLRLGVVTRLGDGASDTAGQP